MTTNTASDSEQRPDTRSRWNQRLRYSIRAAGISGALAGGLLTSALIISPLASAAPNQPNLNTTQSTTTSEQPPTAPCASGPSVVPAPPEQGYVVPAPPEQGYHASGPSVATTFGKATEQTNIMYQCQSGESGEQYGHRAGQRCI
jgi:hypothetical protein